MDTSVQLTYANYLQVSGVQPGSTDFAVNVVGDSDVIDEVIVENDSGILRLPIGPPRLILNIQNPDDSAFTVGTPHTFPLSLSTIGWPVANVVLSANVLEGRADVSFGRTTFDIDAHTTIGTSITVIPHTDAEILIATEAQGSNAAGHGLLKIRAE